ncbi:reverse transcriptase domain-containing protein, partial [Tanacetum coccineum]
LHDDVVSVTFFCTPDARVYAKDHVRSACMMWLGVMENMVRKSHVRFVSLTSMVYNIVHWSGVPVDVVAIRLLCRLQARVYTKQDGDGAGTRCILMGTVYWVGFGVKRYSFHIRYRVGFQIRCCVGYDCDEGLCSMEHISKLTRQVHLKMNESGKKSPSSHMLDTQKSKIPPADNQPLSNLIKDGSSCIDGSVAGLILTNPEGVEFTYAMRFRFEATNNEAEYEALIAGMVQYLKKVKTLTSSFKEFSIKQVPRSENKKVDALSKIASANFAHLSKQVLVEELNEKSINEKEVLAILEEEGNTWMTPICEYLTKVILPKDKKKARAVRRKASRYVVINGTLYKKSFLGPWLRCVGPLQANYVLREIHEGSCSMHSGPTSVVAKAIRTGYYLPSMHTDEQKLIRECNDCQGIDIAGPFPEGLGKVKFLIVSIDYFTKWIETKPVATITGNQVKKFVWDNIVCRFGLPGEIISDNGKQFRDNPFKDWCEKQCIRQCFASVKHPQTNGLVERANRSLGEGIKARLDERSKDWIGELSHFLWAHRTMIKSSNGETPFSLTYDTKVVIPAEIGMPTLWTAKVDLIKNDEALKVNLDLLEEKREQAAIQEVKSKAKMEKYYNSKVRGTSFKPGDMVYRSNDASHAEDGGKLVPKWEGPYEVTESLERERTSLKIVKEMNFRERGTSVCSFMLCDLDFEPLSLSLSSLPSCDLDQHSHTVPHLESFKSELAELSCLLKEQLLEPALNLTVHCCGLEFRVLNGYDQKSFDEERGLNCVVQTSFDEERGLNCVVQTSFDEERGLNCVVQTSFDEERGLNCVVQTSLP